MHGQQNVKKSTLVRFEICKLTYPFFKNDEFCQQLMESIITYI